MPIDLDDVRAALALSEFDHEAAHARMTPLPERMKVYQQRRTPPREAAVLVLIHPERAAPMARLLVVLTRRLDTLRSHSGQVSFPGGRWDPEDTSFTATALRETCEELGLCDGIEVLGALSPLYIPPSHFLVHPVVGYVDAPPHFIPNPAEVALVFGLPLDDLGTLLDAEERVFGEERVRVPFYNVAGHKVWGATAAMLAELEGRLDTVLSL